MENVNLRGIVVDDHENLYVCQDTSIRRSLYKVTPDGIRTVLIDTTVRQVTDIRISPDGKLILLTNNKALIQADVNTGETSIWTNAGKAVTTGDFDSYGNFYCGGKKTDLYIINTNLISTGTEQYKTDTVACVRVFSDYVYVLAYLSTSDTQNPRIAIWRHKISNSTGELSKREVLLDWSTTENYSKSTPYNFSISKNGTFYIATNNSNTILLRYPDGRLDPLYKGILPSYAIMVVWGTKNYVYMVQGGTQKNVWRIDMGSTSNFY